MNITDVGHLTSDADTGDDKMEKGAVREGKTVWDIAARYADAFKSDLNDLNIAPPDVWPKATDHITQMIDLIQKLEKQGYTYTIGDGVYFDTTKFPTYPNFARLDVASLQAGFRVEMGEKRHATDFALWKFSPSDKKRQMEWDSPWGKGFPGWHIECSAMSLAYLPQPIDIHCGGSDHIRVHHTNEIAQAEAATGKPFAKYWLHGEFLTIDKGKMAKSGENFVTLDSVKKQGILPIAYRMFCFSAHYRSPLMFSWESLKAAQQGWEHLKKLVDVETRRHSSETASPSPDVLNQVLASFWKAICDDLNMPVAISEVWNLLRNRDISAGVKLQAIAQIEQIACLDLLKNEQSPAFFQSVDEGDFKVNFVFTRNHDSEMMQRITVMLKERKQAKKEKDFPKADALRTELLKIGACVRDLPGGIVECTLS
jgi:cysteinyl-tRNA synthetase